MKVKNEDQFSPFCGCSAQDHRAQTLHEGTFAEHGFDRNECRSRVFASAVVRTEVGVESSLGRGQWKTLESYHTWNLLSSCSTFAHLK